MVQSKMGEASLRFFLSDLSNSFRDLRVSTTRTEEIVIHEVGHHIQLGLDNEAHYIEEFAKISQWYETGDGSNADGDHPEGAAPVVAQHRAGQQEPDLFGQRHTQHQDHRPGRNQRAQDEELLADKDHDRRRNGQAV